MSVVKLKICEIFSTIQSEGKYAGKAAIFIRLFGTNLTNKDDLNKYASDESSKSRNCRFLTIPEILEVFSSLKDKNNHWVIGGGEPLLQQEGIVELIKEYEKLHGKKPFVEIETNGTILPLKELDENINAFNVSLLLSKSMDGSVNATLTQRVVENSVKFFTASKKTTFKFLIQSAVDIQELQEITNIYKIKPETIWLVPSATTRLDLSKLTLLCWNFCIKYGYWLSSRFQILVFENKKIT